MLIQPDEALVKFLNILIQDGNIERETMWMLEDLAQEIQDARDESPSN